MKDKIMNEVFLSDVSVGQADNIAGEVWAFSLLRGLPLWPPPSKLTSAGVGATSPTGRYGVCRA